MKPHRQSAALFLSKLSSTVRLGLSALVGSLVIFTVGIALMASGAGDSASVAPGSSPQAAAFVFGLMITGLGVLVSVVGVGITVVGVLMSVVKRRNSL